MTQKGLILKIEKDYLVVLTDAHDYVKLCVKTNAMVGQKIFFTDEDLYTPSIAISRFFDNKKLLQIASIFIAVILMGGIWTISQLPGPTSGYSVATVMTVDINPSIKLSLDAEDKILLAEAMNEDAKTLHLDDLIGLSAEDAVEIIVREARLAGFIDADDLTDDYVLITTIPMDTDQAIKTTTLQDKLALKIASSNELQNVTVALMKADKRNLLEAEGKKVPVGLYVVGGQVDMDGNPLSVKDYFSESKHIDDFKDKGQIVDKSHTKKVEQALKFIEKLEAAGIVEAAPLRARLQDKSTDMDALLSDIKTLWMVYENDQSPTNLGHSNDDSTDKVNNKEKDKVKDKDLQPPIGSNNHPSEAIAPTEAIVPTEFPTEKQNDNGNGHNNPGDDNPGSGKDKDKDKNKN